MVSMVRRCDLDEIVNWCRTAQCQDAVVIESIASYPVRWIEKKTVPPLDSLTVEASQ
jgi:hypothetical protein